MRGRLSKHGDPSPVDGGLIQDTTLSKTIKRPLCLVSTDNYSPAKRARLTQMETKRQPSRQSAGLQEQQLAGSVGSISPSRALSRPQIEADARTSTSERPGLTRRNTQLEAKVRQTKTTETEQQLNGLKRPSTTSPEARFEEQKRASSPTLLQKQSIDGDGDENRHQLIRVRLTHENLTEFNKTAREEGTSKASVFALSESTGHPTSTRTTSTTMSGFAFQAYKNGILDPSSSKPPTNIEDIRTRYAESRGTASPTESMYEDYVDTVENACNEATMVFEVGGQLLKRNPREGYKRALNQTFTGFPKDAGFNNSLSAPQPDFIEGLKMPEYDRFPIDEYVKGAVIYKDNPNSLVLPHIAGEWKGPGTDMKKARLQSAYDGAALVYARNQALSYLGKSDPPGHAEVTTFTTDGTNLNLFAHYATPSADGTLEYHQYPVKSTNLIDSHQELKDGRRGLRNAQGHARKQSYTLKDQLKEHWRKHRDGLRPVAEGAPLPVADGTVGETNTDEAGYVVVEQPCHPTTAVSSSISSKSLSPVDDNVSSNSGKKLKASSSRRPSHGPSRLKTKAQKYWRLDAKSGNYYHRHSDGKITWLEDSDDGN